MLINSDMVEVKIESVETYVKHIYDLFEIVGTHSSYLNVLQTQKPDASYQATVVQVLD